MARVTVEDCILVVPNRFELVALASQRAKDISSGAALTVDRDNDKNTVISLREIAEGTVSVDLLREVVVQNSQRKIKTDKFEADPSTTDEASSEVAEEIESFGVNDAHMDDDGMTFLDENVDADD
jgi:DNA-directed RNA polymerase subunit omega